jgi:hypothetical protein
MSVWLWVVIVAIAAIVLLGVAWVAMRSRQTRTLKERFGPEYDRVAADAPTKRDAESELRERRREQLDIRELEPAQRDRYRTQWQGVQADFVDDPAGSVTEADVLIQSVMRERGYPVDDFESRSADLSVDHPIVVENYRAAHGIAVAHTRGKAGTEELRKALQHYRALFDDLLGVRSEEAARR